MLQIVFFLFPILEFSAIYSGVILEPLTLDLTPESIYLQNVFIHSLFEPVLINNSNSRLAIENSIFTATVSRAIFYFSTHGEVNISKTCITGTKTQYAAKHRTVGVFVSIKTPKTKVDYISLSNFNGEGHVSIFINSTSISSSINDTNNVFYTGYASLCFEGDASISFMNSVDLQGENRCSELNSGTSTMNFVSFFRIILANPSAIFSLFVSTASISNMYFAASTAPYLYKDSVSICSSSNIYSDIAITEFGSVIDIGDMAITSFHELPYYCDLKHVFNVYIRTEFRISNQLLIFLMFVSLAVNM